MCLILETDLCRTLCYEKGRTSTKVFTKQSSVARGAYGMSILMDHDARSAIQPIFFILLQDYFCGWQACNCLTAAMCTGHAEKTSMPDEPREPNKRPGKPSCCSAVSPRPAVRYILCTVKSWKHRVPAPTYGCDVIMICCCRCVVV